jgi:hypothetical protein
MGAQLIGLTARTIKKNHQIELKRLTGLDPAMPGFEPVLPWSFQPLTASDG